MATIQSHSHVATFFAQDKVALYKLERDIVRFIPSLNLMGQGCSESKAFLETIDGLISTRNGLQSHALSLLHHADDLVRKSMMCLQDEFRSMMERAKGTLEKEVSAISVASQNDDDAMRIPPSTTSTDITGKFLPQLHQIAKRMAAAGYGDLCSVTYAVSRLAYVNETMQKMGLCQWSLEEIQGKSLSELEKEVPRWVESMDFIFNVSLPYEHRLCDCIFLNLTLVSDVAFDHVASPVMIPYLDFANVLAGQGNTLGQLEPMAHVYETLRDVAPTIDSLFHSNASSSVPSEFASVYARLEKSIKRIFKDAERSIFQGPGNQRSPTSEDNQVQLEECNNARKRNKLSQERMQESNYTSVMLNLHDLSLTSSTLSGSTTGGSSFTSLELASLNGANGLSYHSSSIGSCTTECTDTMALVRSDTAYSVASPSFIVEKETLRRLESSIFYYTSSSIPIWPGCYSTDFIRAVDELIAIKNRFQDPGVDKRFMDQVNNILRDSMLRLEVEFKALLYQSQEGLMVSDVGSTLYGEGCTEDGSSIQDSSVTVNSLPDLVDISRRMVSAGSPYGEACVDVYRLSRLHFMQGTIDRLGFHRWSVPEIYTKSWVELKEEIVKWVDLMWISFSALFPREHHLCCNIFCYSNSVADNAFNLVCYDMAIQLLEFADTMAVLIKAIEHLDLAIGIYETLRDLTPKINLMFSGQFSSFIQDRSKCVLARLVMNVQSKFLELENIILEIKCPSDKFRLSVVGNQGDVHKITKCALDVLLKGTLSWSTLEEIMGQELMNSCPEAGAPATSFTFRMKIVHIMDILFTNLQEKSKEYDNPSLGYVFLINNGQYILKKVKDNELANLLGEDWIQQIYKRVQQWNDCYQRDTWSKLVSILRDEEHSGSITPYSTRSWRKKLQQFNTLFEDICQVQSGWVVIDEDLREEMKTFAVKFMVVPAYQSFLENLNQVLGRKKVEKYVRYSVEQVDASINGLFQGDTNGLRCSTPWREFKRKNGLLNLVMSWRSVGW